MSRRFSIAHLSLIEAPPAELVRIAAQAGYDLVDLRLAPATSNDRVYGHGELAALARDLAPLLRDAGLKVWDLEIIRLKNDTRPGDYRPLMETAALGASRLKLVTATLDEAAALVRAVADSGVKTLVGHHRRYLAAIQEAKRRIDAGALGKLVAASVTWATRKPDRYFDTQWRTQAGGGPILINAIHEIDMLRHLCGEIRTLSGVTSNARRGFAVEDSAAASFVFDNGGVGTLVCTDAGFSPWTIEQGTGENPSFAFTGESAYRLIGTQGSLELPVLRQWGAAVPGDIGWDRPITATGVTASWHDPYVAQLEHFQRVIRLDEPAMVSVADGANTLAATLAVAQSAASGKQIAPRRFDC